MSVNELPAIGAPRNRVDGPLEVTGAARYAADWPADGLAYGYIVQSTIANGRVTKIDSRGLRAKPGVIAIMTHENAPRVDARARRPRTTASWRCCKTTSCTTIASRSRSSIADTLRARQICGVARHASATPRSRRARSFAQGIDRKPKDDPRQAARHDARRRRRGVGRRPPCSVDNLYTTPIEHHNPMEPHATIAMWEGDRLTALRRERRGRFRRAAASPASLALPVENVEVITKFAGGAFGSKGSRLVAHDPRPRWRPKLTNRPVQIALVAAADVGAGRQPAGDAPARRARSGPRRPADGADPRNDVRDVDVRRVRRTLRACSRRCCTRRRRCASRTASTA